MIQIRVCARILEPQPADICSLSTCTLTKTNAGYFFWSWPWKSGQSPIYVYFFSDFRKKILVFHLDDGIRCVFISRFRLSQIQRQSLGYTVTGSICSLSTYHTKTSAARKSYYVMCTQTGDRSLSHGQDQKKYPRVDAKVGTSQKSSFLKAAAWCLLPLLCPSNRKLLSDGVFIRSFIRLLQ